MKHKIAKPRRDRGWPQTERIVSENFPRGFSQIEGKCYVPLRDFRKLERRYIKMFNRYQKSKEVVCKQVG